MTSTDRKAFISLGTIIFLLPGIFGLPTPSKTKFSTNLNPDNYAKDLADDFKNYIRGEVVNADNYPEFAGNGNGWMKYYAGAKHSREDEMPEKAIEGEDEEQENEEDIAKITKMSNKEPYPTENFIASWNGIQEQKRDYDENARSTSRYYPDYDEYVYKLRAIPYLFKKRANEKQYNQLEQKSDGAMNLILKHLFGEQEESESPQDGTASSNTRATIPSLFRRHVPFLFRRGRPSIVRGSQFPAIKDKSVPYLFRKSSLTPVMPLDDKTRKMDFLFRRGNFANSVFPTLQDESDESNMEDKRRILSGLF